jgi:DNA-binding response OmpR family regulator
VLDLGLSEIDGWAVLERIREVSDVPVMVVTARNLETDKARGRLSGADDYLAKPSAELLARIKALLRRSSPTDDAQREYRHARLAVDVATRTVVANGHRVELTPTEFRLLALLVRHAGQVFLAARDPGAGLARPLGHRPRRVRFTALNLRRKLRWSSLPESPIETVRGFGCRYRATAG